MMIKTPKKMENWKNWYEYNKTLPEKIEFTLSTCEFIDEITKNIQADLGTILEVGCSNGRYLSFLKTVLSVKEVVGVDIVMCETKTGIIFIRGDGHNLPIKDDTIDLVYSIGLLEHFMGEERTKMIGEQIRVLKPRGYLIIYIPNCTIGALRLMKVKFRDLFRDINHFIVNRKKWKKGLNDQGIEILSEKFIGWSLHIKDFIVPIPKLLLNNKFLADDYIIIGTKK